MRTVGISMMFALLVSGAAACGGDDGGSDNADNNNDDNTDDITVDDNVDDNVDDTTDNTDGTLPDAPSGGLTGLGQACVPAMEGRDCPANTPACLSGQGDTLGICTNLCINNGTFMTNAESQPTNIQPADFSTGNPTCEAIYTGGPSGIPSCSAIANVMPTGAFTPNTNYTFIVACQVECGTGDSCPAGLTCEVSTTMGIPSTCKP
jgi:hypothetical protein